MSEEKSVLRRCGQRGGGNHTWKPAAPLSFRLVLLSPHSVTFPKHLAWFTLNSSDTEVMLGTDARLFRTGLFLSLSLSLSLLSLRTGDELLCQGPYCLRLCWLSCPLFGTQPRRLAGALSSSYCDSSPEHGGQSCWFVWSRDEDRVSEGPYGASDAHANAHPL